MSRIPAPKRRKLTPPSSSSDNEESVRSSTAKNGAATINDFYKQAASWNLEQAYETKPRKGKKKDKESTRLPIKTADGLIHQVEIPEEVEKEEDAESDKAWLEGEDSGDEIEDQEQIEEESKVPVHQQILNAQEELAKLATILNEEPEENAGAFKSLAAVGETKISTIKKLTIATQLAVYQDVIPGYRIRPLSDADMEIKVSKDVKRLRAYEQSLVAGYQAYIKELARYAKSSRGWEPTERGPSLSSIAISCVCELLKKVPHFNFRGELLKILVSRLSTKKIDEDFIKCREAIETLFQEDEDGTASLDAVSQLTKMMKARNYHIDESVLNTFLHLRLLSEFSWKASQNHVDKPKGEGDVVKIGGKKIKEKRVFRTKKQRKMLKEQKAIDKEMAEADATVAHEERDRMQAETLKLVFVTYFRILKLRTSSLMGAVLEGLARYAHLINQDFFGDLLEALKDLISKTQSGVETIHQEDETEEADEEDTSTPETRNLSRESLLCVITAFALLEGQDVAKAAASLSLDLSFFVTHLYRTLHALSLNADIELSAKSLHLPDPNLPSHLQTSTAAGGTKPTTKINIQTTTVLLLRSLSATLLPPHNIRSVPPLRIAAFTKQLLTSSLHLPEKSTTAMLGLVEKVTKTHQSKIAALWNTEERKGDGRFDPLSGEVEGSNPFACTVWEGELLRLHYAPAVREGLVGIERNVVGVDR